MKAEAVFNIESGGGKKMKIGLTHQATPSLFNIAQIVILSATLKKGWWGVRLEETKGSDMAER